MELQLHVEVLVVWRVWVALFVTSVAALAMATPAQAAPGGIEVSPDGVTFASDYPGFLFTTISALSPGDTDQAEFYLRNSSNEPGFLRVTLRDVTTSDSDLANALSLTASTFGHPGTSATLLEANPCRVLLEGQTVAPGEVVRVSTSLELAQLSGVAGQGASAIAYLSVALSGTDLALPPTDCGPTGTVLPVTPGQNPGPNTPRSTTSSAFGAAFPDFSAGPTAPVAQPDLPVLSPPGLFGIDPNTWHLLEEYLILIPLGAIVVGATVFGIVTRRRREGDAQLETTP